MTHHDQCAVRRSRSRSGPRRGARPGGVILEGDTRAPHASTAIAFENC